MLRQEISAYYCLLSAKASLSSRAKITPKPAETEQNKCNQPKKKNALLKLLLFFFLHIVDHGAK